MTEEAREEIGTTIIKNQTKERKVLKLEKLTPGNQPGTEVLREGHRVSLEGHKKNNFKIIQEPWERNKDHLAQVSFYQ